MKIKYVAILTSLSIALTLSSCGEDFLYKAPQGSIDQGALANAQGVDLLVTNAYANLTENDWGASIFNWALSGMYGGDANKGSESGDQSVLNEMEVYATMATNGYLNEKWNWIYKGSKRVNMALQVMNDASDMDEGLKTIRKGELLFLRAMFYFEGVRVFGPYIPYIDDSYTENDPKVHNDKDIYTNILADIDAAIGALPNKPSEAGRVYAWAAKALKAKILAQRGDLATAKPILADLLTNGSTASGKKYALANNMNDNWDSFKDNTSPESIWEIQFSADGPNDNGNAGMSLCYPHNSGPGGCCGFYQPSYELANSYQVDANGLPYLNGEYRSKPSHTVKGPNNEEFLTIDQSIAVDPRMDFAIGRWGIPYKDYGLPDPDWVRRYTDGGIFLPKKHVYSKAEGEADLGRSGMYGGWAPGSAMNIQYLSVRDAMLLYAECLANDGELSAAIDLVNQIRTRAARDENIIKNANGQPAANYKIATYPAAHAVFTDKATCVKAIRMERKLELAMEGQRFFDLARWGGDYMAAELAAYVDYEKNYINKFGGAAHLPASKTMFPIPDGQIQTMGNDENGQPYLVQPDAWK
ncbi:MAG: RagB/SusD family nutrient uptake outer membrane protein [Tannerellaceae bacterium]|nr:RagB/SusD family nutrient uptake outer membrane protein [Tannerellaceae bacterium]